MVEKGRCAVLSHEHGHASAYNQGLRVIDIDTITIYKGDHEGLERRSFLK